MCAFHVNRFCFPTTILAMEGDYPEVPIEMTKLFHRIDRELYSALVFNLQCNPRASMLAIAFWIWLEHITLENVVTKILLSSSLEMINGLFNEAVICLGCIANTMCYFSHTSSELSLTQHLLGQHLSLKYLYENRVVASDGIKNIVSRVCLKALKDLMEMAIHINTQQHLVQSEMAHINCFLGDLSSQSGGVPRRMPTIKAPKGKRTMFATFSKGIPVCEGEIRLFFEEMFGDCIDSISMQVVKPNEQPLFALVVFTTPGIIDFILNGTAKAKFSINGKPVWMRKFLPKS
ncbi:unnamed protein product [Cuscuta campestris]|uniref:RRM domain-containing protein n=1 Tax=Cuscuta campestris TaxID=132261 RepID=A0A484LYI2_9ASTE|nr:unnamed protein product [Cuscuta campestris]